jgi:hypothetical protein
MTVEAHPDMRAFFRDRLLEALERRMMRVPEITEFYLVQLLARHVRATSELDPTRTLVERLLEAESSPANDRLTRYREMGDAALYACGFFGDHLDRRGISRDYVATMGGRAYHAAHDLSRWGSDRDIATFAEVFEELAREFAAYATVLDEVRELTAMRTPQDIVRLYDRWRKTRSPSVAERLRQAGLFPRDVDDPTLH